METIKFILMTLCLLTGLFIFVVATFGLFKFKYVLNRVHSAAMCDTMASFMIILGLIIFFGFSVDSLKLFFVIVFLWITNPVASHVLVKTEYLTDIDDADEYEVIESDLL